MFNDWLIILEYLVRLDFLFIIMMCSWFSIESFLFKSLLNIFVLFVVVIVYLIEWLSNYMQHVYPNDYMKSQVCCPIEMFGLLVIIKRKKVNESFKEIVVLRSVRVMTWNRIIPWCWRNELLGTAGLILWHWSSLETSFCLCAYSCTYWSHVGLDKLWDEHEFLICWKNLCAA
jgi:hypothetical protein